MVDAPVRSSAPRRSAVEAVRRAQIVDAAIAVVAEEGYARASMARIAQQAGLSKGLLSYHFRNKEHLLEPALRTTFAAITEAIVDQLDVAAPAPGDPPRHPSPARRLRGRPPAAAARPRPDHPKPARCRGRPLVTLADYDGAYSQLEQLYRKGQREGSFRSFDTRVMAVTQQAAIDTMFAYADAYPATDLRQYAAALADLLLAAVASPALADG